MPAVRIAMVASECEPYAKTGGLADVVDALSRALGKRGHEVDVFLPWYRGLVPPGDLEAQPLKLAEAGATVWTGRADGYRLRLVEHPASFDREGYYGSGTGDFPDNGARFALLGRAALAAMRAAMDGPHVVHGHDWQAGPVLLSLVLRERPGAVLAGTAAMLTCHNLAYHGWVPRERVTALALPGGLGEAAGIDLLREAVLRADLVNTVSPTFAVESLAPEFGGGLDDVLRSRGDRYSGIVNGIDTQLWDPARDASLAARYSTGDLSGKGVCRADLAARHGLDPEGTLLGVVGRLDPQKGFDLVAAAASRLVAAGARLIALGTGDHALVTGLQALAAERPDRIAVVERFDRDEARRIYAGADLFLMPSRFEPCGQGQLIALRYGTPPVVHAVGGLVDTVRDADAHPDDGNGFSFQAATPEALLDAVARASAARADGPRFAAIQARGMMEDVSWAGPAARYEEAYERAMALLDMA
jgi:starch synthase